MLYIKNEPTLASCSFDKHLLYIILIMFGKWHQHTFTNDMDIQLFYPFTFTYFIRL